MKKMNCWLVLFASLLMAAASTVMFSSCSDDDDEDDPKKAQNGDSSKDDENNGEDDTTSQLGNYPYVDLGLPSGLKWAIYNVGATKPEEYGDYFAWGETQPKEGYSWSTYKWCNDSRNSMTKYCTDTACGIVDNKSLLAMEDDAARANWGGSWRMPTKVEINELIDGCTWEWTDNYNGTGIKGQEGISKKNGNVIFLPAAGFSDLYHVGEKGHYWTSILSDGDPDRSYHLTLSDESVDWVPSLRSHGYSVRAVSK